MSLPTQPAAADAVTSSDPLHPVEPELQLQVCRKLRTKLALGQASAVVLAGMFWWLGSRQGMEKGATVLVKTI